MFNIMDNIRIEYLINGYLLQVDDGEGNIQRFAFEVDDDDPDGLKDGFLDMLSTIIDACEKTGSKHDKLRPHICYQAGDVSETEREELQKKTDWGII